MSDAGRLCGAGWVPGTAWTPGGSRCPGLGVLPRFRLSDAVLLPGGTTLLPRGRRIT
ncbi:hypothetical protein ABZ250_26980 [Streptomyces afghaniensis]|uniref:hypothetical protein n=1 Tax=Streptomyces afghaniensis TaxID=66865 RepID=UPI00339F6860